ncbi:MAG: formate dehydrogenase accessory sulfurtransferase FdhD [Candidatus Thorarchaeota archaeon]
MTEPITEIQCIRIVEGVRNIEKERIATEVELTLTINDQIETQFSYSVGLAEQLVVGYLLSSGIIRSLNDIERIDLDDGQCSVRISKEKEIKSEAAKFSSSISFERLLEAKEKLTNNQQNHKATRGFHGALLMELSSSRVFTCEDIGRHNAVDKVIGYCFQQGYSFSDSMLLLTGRLTSNIVQKGTNSGIPVVASLTVATDEGIAKAKESNTTVIGAITEDGCWLYNEGATKLET